MVTQSDSRTLSNFVKGSGAGPPVFVPASTACSRIDEGAYQTLLTSLTERYPRGFGALGPDVSRGIAQAAQLLSPGNLARRAQFTVHSAAQLAAFLRLGLAPGRRLNGFIYLDSTETPLIALEGFRGRCVIATAGPAVIGDIRLADLARDSITIYSPSFLQVTGRTVQAGLISLSPQSKGVGFVHQARILGPVMSAIFPSVVGIPSSELGAVAIGTNAALDCADSARKPPRGPASPEDYFAMFSPYPLKQEHGRE